MDPTAVAGQTVTAFISSDPRRGPWFLVRGRARREGDSLLLERDAAEPPLVLSAAGLRPGLAGAQLAEFVAFARERGREDVAACLEASAATVIVAVSAPVPADAIPVGDLMGTMYVSM